MLEISKARQLILQSARPRPATTVATHAAFGRVLAQDVRSDADSPPFPKALMDGYAVRSADVTAAATRLVVLEQVTAGNMPSRSLTPGTASQVMTGAPLPPDADAVVMVEQTRRDGDHVIIDSPAVPGQNLMPQAGVYRQGDTILAAGRRLRAIEIALAGEVGLEQLAVVPSPSVAILSTGDELCEIASTPGPGQIRNSNGPMLECLAQSCGGQVNSLGIARDEPQELSSKIHDGLTSDVLILSGGVSAGVLDLVPRTLAEAGVETIFHKINLKPGKPLWFGVRSRDAGHTLVFGLPGNPVSSLVCFELFVRPALQRLAGQAEPELPIRTARLKHTYRFRGGRPTYFPARISWTDAGYEVATIAWKGSSDLPSVSQANGFAIFEGDPRELDAGERVPVWLLGDGGV